MSKNLVFLGIYTRIPAEGSQEAPSKSRWHVWSLEAGQFLAQEVIPGSESQGPSQQIDSNEFFNCFRVHAAFSANGKRNTPKMPEEQQAQSTPQTDAKAPLDNTATSGLNIFDDDEPAPVSREEKSTPATFFKDKNVQTDASSQAEPFITDLEQLEQQMRSDFSLALIRLQSNRDLALESLSKLSESQANFSVQHKFMFTDFGTALRRRHLYSLAFRFHERAQLLAPDDEHILFNMARALFDSGKVDKARSHLEQAVAMSSDFQAGSDFLAFIDGKNKRCRR